MSPRTIVGIVAVLLLAVVIGIFVQRNEREFQRERRERQASTNTSGPSATTLPPAQQSGAAPTSGGYGGYNAGGTPGSEAWTRYQIADQWSASRDCSNLMEFRADGSTSAGGVSGTWTFQGGNLTVVEPGQTTVFEVVSIGTDDMTTQVTGYREVTWHRC